MAAGVTSDAVGELSKVSEVFPGRAGRPILSQLGDTVRHDQTLGTGTLFVCARLGSSGSSRGTKNTIRFVAERKQNRASTRRLAFGRLLIDTTLLRYK